jgi:hypothetical protein
MKKLNLLVIFISIFTALVFGQKITGKVVLHDNKPAEFAVVLLLHSKDSSVVKTSVADENGLYELVGIKNGSYFLNTTYIGYKKYYSQLFNYDNTDINAETIKLEEAKNELNTLNVVARKPLIEVQSDKTILNVDASISNAGANGLELLRKAPGVMLDNNENIQLRGKNGVIVYIDGKRSFLAPTELANLLKSLNSSDIEAIEVITNPSAKYDAAGNAGIINIRLKKNKNIGSNGSVNISSAYGLGPKNNISVSLNNRNKKTNIFGTVGVGRSEWHNNMNLNRTQNERIFDQRQKQVSYNTPLNGKFGIDYYANSKHTFGFLANANTNIGDKKWESDSRTNISKRSTPSLIDSILIAANSTVGNFVNANFNANYRFADTLGNEVTFDVDRGYYYSDNTSFQPNRYVNALENEVFSTRDFEMYTPSNIDIYTIKGDYEHKFKKKGHSISTGFKYADVTTDNTFDFFNVINNQNQRDVTQSNEFKYTERVAAAYLNTNYIFSKKLSLQAGLRYEHTSSIGDLIRDPSQSARPNDYVARNYDNLFPSAALTYNLTEKHGFNLTYSRRIDRPNYEDLNPFEWRLDELSFRKGSPFLRPQYSDNYEAKYIFMGFASLGASYSRTTDLITDIVEFDPSAPNKSFINYRNLASQDNYALTLSTPTPIKKWWNGFLNVTMFKAIYKANFPEYSFTAETPIAWNVYCEQTFSLPKGFTYEVSGWFNSTNIWGGSWISKPQGALDMGIQKKILKSQGSLKLSVTDIFFTAPWRSYSEAIPGLIISGNGAWESRQVRLNFNYRFGKNTVKGARSRKTGLEEEKSRIKG